MTKVLGRQIALGIAKEASRGVAETVVDYWVSLLSRSVDDVIEQVVDESSVGVIEDSINAAMVKKTAKMEWEANIGDKSFGLLLLAALGTDTPGAHAGETIVYDHVYSILQSAQHPSLTVFVDDPGITVYPTVGDYTHRLCMLESLEINAEANKFATFKIGMRGKAGVANDLTPSYSVENNFISKHGTFKVATNLAGLNAASAVTIKKFNLKFEKNLEDDDVLGSNEPADINNKELKCEGSVELLWDSEVFKSAMLADTAKAMRIDLINTDVTLGNAANPELKIDLAKVKFSEVARKMDNKDLILQTLKFKALYSVTDAKLLVVTLTNLVATY